ncbi:MAG: hypothetical protein CL799_07300 [Chromatiales bacterium]|jgi:hypothetical protein|nr:hypothetical protein [Chromatiales bacterium]MDP6150660.1 hypothetical protein [Gammaproteobacteria bacterium]MDP7269952.1 hypothetical protein [Gammaproteobacteria bacterium]HJP05500.1 hypothetical protein [Gammaproteobacteria bacterium]
MQDQELDTERRIVTTFEEVRDVVIEVASQAERSITIQTPDLEPGIYDNEEFLEVLKRLMLAKPYARLRVLVTDPSRAVRSGNRFIALMRRLNTYLDVRNLHTDYRGKFNDAFIIADESAVLYRTDGRRYDGILGSGEPAIARLHLEAFEKPWEESVFNVEEHRGQI